MKYLTLFIILTSPLLLRAQDYSDTTKYDPNDPNCPCYNIQKQAEQEYAELQQQKQDSISAARKPGFFKRIFGSTDDQKSRKRKNKKRKNKDECPEVFLVPYKETKLFHNPFC